MSDAPPPGWYPDPQDPAGQRWWDGAAWSEHAAGPSAGQPTAAAGPTVAPDPWLWQSILVTVVSLCTCSVFALPAGLTAIVFAARSRGAADAGDLTLARANAATARTWTLVQLGMFAFTVLLLVALFAVGVLDEGSSSFDLGTL